MSPMRSWPNSAWGVMPRSSNMAESGWGGAPCPSPKRLALLHERAIALVDGTEGLRGRDGRAELIVVPRLLGLLGLLHLEEVHVVHLAAVGADGALAEQAVVGGRGLHLLDHGLAVGVALLGLERLQIVGDGGIDAGVDHRR